MVQLPYNTYLILIGAILMLSAITFGVIISYFRTLRKLSNYEKKESEIIEAAQNKATEIIDQAQNIHETSISNLEKAAADLEKHEEEELAKQSDQALKSFSEKIDELNTNNQTAYAKTAEDVKKELNLHFEEMKKLLAEQTFAAEKMAQEKVQTEYDTLHAELAEYKKRQLEKIDRNIYQILLNVSKAVFGERLDLKEHEQIIINALSEAEKEIN